MKKFTKYPNVKQWFTFLELIISISILAIISIVSYTNIWKFLKENNDSIRQTHINQIALALWNVNWKLPLPDDYTSLYFSWQLIWFQWIFCNTDFSKLGLTAKIKDPETWKCYAYLLNSNQDKYQLYTYLFIDNKPYIIWNDELWIITTWDETINASYTWSLDLFDTSKSYKIYKNEDESFVSNTLKPMIRNCNDIKKYWIWKENWIYTVYSWTTDKKVYCNMDIKSWWWTVIVNVTNPTNGWDWNGITDLWTYNTWNNWIFSRIWVNSLIDNELWKHQALIRYADGNYVILNYYSWDIQSFYDWNYAVQISSDNCVAKNGRCGDTSSNVSWWYFCNDKDPFFESYTVWTWWDWSTPDKSSYDCVDKVWTFVGIR